MDISASLGIGILGAASLGSGSSASAAAYALVGAAGIPSAEAFGVAGGALYRPGLTGFTGIGTAEYFGAGGDLAFPITGSTGIPSGEAFGAATGTLGAIIAGAAGLPSTEAFGAAGSVLYSTGTDIIGRFGDGLPSAEAFGSTRLVMNLVGAAGIPTAETLSSAGTIEYVTITGFFGIPSAEAFGVGALLGARDFTLFIGGDDKSDLLSADTMTITSSLNSRTTGQFSLFDPMGDYDPPIGVEVLYYAGTTRVFGGSLEQTQITNWIGNVANMLACNVSGYEQICDNRIVGKVYTESTGGIASITIADIVRTTLAGDGITYEFTGDPGVGLGTQVFNYVTVTAALNQIMQACSWTWHIDAWKVLRIFPPSGTTSGATILAPFSIADNDGNWRTATVQKVRSQYRNRQGVKPSQNLASLWTDTFTGGGGRQFFVTTYIPTAAPLVYVNGVQQVVTALGDYSVAWDWFWIPNGYGVEQNFSAPPLGIGDTLEVVYPSPLPAIVWAQDDAQIAERAAVEDTTGLYEAVEEAQDVTDLDAAQALAVQLLARYSGAGIPVTLTFETDRLGLQPGQLLTSTITRPIGGAANFLIDQVVYKEISQQITRCTITAIGSAAQGRWWQFYQRLIGRAAQPVNRIIEKATFNLAVTIPGVTNPGVSVCDPAGNAWIARKIGVVKDVSGYFITPPEGSPIIIDVKKNGTSIFGPQKLAIPQGSSAPTTVFQFAVPSIPVAPNDIFTCAVLQVGATTPGSDGSVVVTMWA